MTKTSVTPLPHETDARQYSRQILSATLIAGFESTLAIPAILLRLVLLPAE